MTRNLPTLRTVATDPGVLTNLPIDTLDALLAECADETTIIGAAKKALTNHFSDRYATAIAGAYQAQGKDFGAVRVSDGGYEILADTPKKVEWDQDALAAVLERIKFSGDNPSEYIKTTLTVSETAYNAWPEAIRATFEPARTVRPGTMTIKIVRKEAA